MALERARRAVVFRPSDGEAIVHLGDPWCVHGRSLGGLAFAPRMHRACQRHGIPGHQDVDAPRIDICILMQRADDSRLNVLGRGCGRRARRDGDAVGDPFDAFDVAERLLGGHALVQRVDRSRQRHVTVMDDGLYARRQGGMLLECPGDVCGDIRIDAFKTQCDLQIVGDGAHTAGAFDRAFGGQLADVRLDESGEGHHAVASRHADGAGVHL